MLSKPRDKEAEKKAKAGGQVVNQNIIPGEGDESRCMGKCLDLR